MTKPKLKLVTPHAEPHANIVLYGLPGSGKTVAAASAPKPLLYVNADQPNATRFAHAKYDFDEVRMEGLQTLYDVTDAAGDYTTIVIDTIGETFQTLLDESSSSALHPTLNAYGDSGTHLERCWRKLMELPVNTVFVCHEIEVKDEGTGSVERLPFTTTKSGSAVFAAKLMAAADIVGYTGVVQTENEGISRVAQLFNGGGRRGKDRFGVLGDSRTLELSEWIEVAKRGSTETAEPKKKAAKTPQKEGAVA